MGIYGYLYTLSNLESALLPSEFNVLFQILVKLKINLFTLLKFEGKKVEHLGAIFFE